LPFYYNRAGESKREEAAERKGDKKRAFIGEEWGESLDRKGNSTYNIPM